jgi:GNAT superfamily N-acetyltransferase
MSPRSDAVEPGALKRVGAGSYRTPDGRFSVEQASGRWLVLDAELADDLGLPLTRGPFPTLDAARDAIAQARAGGPPTSDLDARMAALRSRGPSTRANAPRRPTGRGKPGRATGRRPAPPEIRTYRPGEGARLREFWETVGFRSLERLAERNPGLVLVAEADDRIVGTTLGAWDGRRAWLYHVAVAGHLRRTGLGRRLVREAERRLRALGCLKVNVIVLDDNQGATRFWTALGYTSLPARQYGREL